MEFLREIAYLRPRTNTFGAVFRIRSEAAFAIHNFSTSAASCMCIPPSSPAATARAPARCSR